MAKINLLPWREELRKERQKQFGIAAGIAAVAMVVVIGLVHFYIADQISNQLSRNSFLEAEIKKLDAKIAEIKDLEKQKTNLLARMNIIQQLQRSRPEVVHVFDELISTLPEGVYLTEIVNQGSVITVKGFAQSNARVSSYMRNVDAAGWLANPKLSVIITKEAERQRTSEFTLLMSRKAPKVEMPSADKKKGRRGRGRGR